MPDFVSLTCPSCGGKLEITDDIDRFACGHCGNEHVVRRGGGIIALSPVAEGLKRVQVGVDKTASELAIRRLENEIEDLERSLQCVDPLREWFDKQMRGLSNEGVLVRRALQELVNSENPNKNVPLWKKVFGSTLKVHECRERLHRATPKDLETLIRSCKANRSHRPEGAVRDVVHALSILMTGEESKRLAKDKRDQLRHHQGIVDL